MHSGAGVNPFRDDLAIFFSEVGPYLLLLLFIIAWFFTDDKKKVVLIEATEASLLGLILN
jgi:hypothetical protein